MHLIIDSDPLVYACGFSAEQIHYHVITEDPYTGEIEEHYFTPSPKYSAYRNMWNYLDANTDLEVVSEEKRVIPGTKEEAIAAVRTKLYSIENEVKKHYGIITFDKIDVVLSGPGNYRERIATIRPYKGNRDATHKPYWYQAIRDYICTDWGGRVVSGREADDECSILAHRDWNLRLPYVIATIDKDLDQIPGEHYNYLKQVFYAVTESDAKQWFYIQCLSGDATDGIPGCWRVGPERATERIRQLLTKHVMDSATGGRSSSNTAFAGSVNGTSLECSASISWDADGESALWREIVAAYEESKTKAACPYVDRDAEATAVETARLVYLQKEEGQLWSPPGTPMGRLPGYEEEADE